MSSEAGRGWGKRWKETGSQRRIHNRWSLPRDIFLDRVVAAGGQATVVVGGRKMQGSTFGNNKMVPHANETKMSGAKGGYEKSMAEEAVGGEVGDKEGVIWGEGGAPEMLS